MSNDKTQYNGQNGNGYQPLPCAPTPPPGPEVDAPTLADAQSGGRVRLRDQALCNTELRRNAHVLVLQEMRTRFTDAGSPSRTAALDAAIAALSAHPSPGGQDALAEAARRVISDVDSGDYHGEISESTYAALEAALAARQPVSETDTYQKGFRDGQDRTCTVAARQPVAFDYPKFNAVGMACVLEDRGVHFLSDAARYGFDEAVDQMKATLESIGPLYAAPPAQAVVLGRWSQRHADDLDVAVHTALSVHAGSLSQKKRTAISDYVKRLLIDSQAVGK